MKNETELPPLYDHDFVTLKVLFTKFENEEEYNEKLRTYNEQMEEWENKDYELQKIQIEDKPIAPKPNILTSYQEALFNISDMIVSHIHEDKEDDDTVVKIYYSSRTSTEPKSMVVYGELKDFINILKNYGARIQ